MPKRMRLSASRRPRLTIPQMFSRTLRLRRPFYSASRQLIQARVHNFKRCGLAFGLSSAAAPAGTPSLVNVSSSPNGQIAIGGAILSPFNTGTVDFGGAFMFQLAHASNIAEITSLFDNYRIKSVNLKFILSFTSSDSLINSAGNGYTHGAMPVMHYTYDPDDATTPTSLTDVMENSYAKSVRLDKPFSINITPRAQQTVVQTTSTTAAAGGLLNRNTWLDCDAKNVPHYGLKFWMSDWPVTAVGGNISLMIIPTYYLECKNVV